MGLVKLNMVDFKVREAKWLMGLKVHQGGVEKPGLWDRRSATVEFNINFMV